MGVLRTAIRLLRLVCVCSWRLQSEANTCGVAIVVSTIDLSMREFFQNWPYLENLDTDRKCALGVACGFA
jgi:hypothetical protein